MNLKDILELEEFKNTLIGNALRWWITERLDRKIEDVMWWNVREHPPIIGSTEHIELSACFKDGTPFVQMFQKEELREKVRATHDVEEQDASVMIPVHDWIWQDFKKAYTTRNKDKPKTDDELMEIVHDWTCRAMQYYTRYNMEDPWTLVEAYEIALSCPDIQLQECKTKQGSQRTWNITVQYPEYNAYAVGVNDLYHKLNTAKEYVETLKKKEPRSTRDIIRESYEIAETCPAMIIEELKHGWSISFEDDDYSVEALDAVHLLAEVKEAKAYWEALGKPEKERTDTKHADNNIIHVDRLDQSTKRLLIGFIENMTIGEAVCTLIESDVYPHIALGELYGINIQLRESLEKERSQQ